MGAVISTNSGAGGRAGDAPSGSGTAGRATAAGLGAAETSQSEPADRRWDRLALAVLAIFGGLLLHSAWSVGPTYDEHYYIASGYAYWQEGDFALNREHPPLVKLLVGLPLLLAPDVHWSGHAGELLSYPVAFFFQRNGDHIDRNLFLARLPLCLLSTILALALWRTARRMAGSLPALLSLTAFAFNPNVLAHGPLAALDSGLTAFLFFAVLAFCNALREFTWRRVLWSGIAFGLANLAKFTSLILGPFTFLLALVAFWRGPRKPALITLAATWLIGLTVFAAGYGFEMKSIAQVWSRGSYQAPAARDQVGPDRAELLREVEELSPATAAALRDALDEETWLDRAQTSMQSKAPAERRAGRAVLKIFENAEGPARKRAFDVALEHGGQFDSEHTQLLASLAGLHLQTEAGWRAWYAANRELPWDTRIFTQDWIRSLVRGTFGDGRPVPLLSAFKGIDYQMNQARVGHGTYFRGKVLPAGSAFANGNPHPEYFAVVMGVKNPLAWLAAMALGFAAALGARSKWSAVERLAYLGFPLGLFAMFSAGSALLGVKYVLPIFPFMALWIAPAARRWPRVLSALMLIAVAESIWIHPRELMYYNVAAGGPLEGPAITVVGDDWGQGVRELGRWYADNRDWVDAAGGLYCDPYTRADRAAFGLQDTQPVREGVRGIVALHAIDAQRERERYAWLTQREPIAHLGYSVLIYDTR